MIMHTCTSGTQTHQCDSPIITTKVFDIIVYPSECQWLILQPHVSRDNVILGAQKSKCTQSILHRDENNIVIDQICFTLVRARAVLESTAVNPKYHWQCGVDTSFRRHVNVKVQAVLGTIYKTARRKWLASVLQAKRWYFIGDQFTWPWLYWLRLLHRQPNIQWQFFGRFFSVTFRIPTLNRLSPTGGLA